MAMATGRFPWIKASICTGLVYLGLSYELDYHLMQYTVFSEIHPFKIWPKSYRVWWWFWMSSPTWLSGIFLKVTARKQKEHLEQVFTDTGLKSKTGRTPAPISTRRKGDGTFKQKFKNRGFSKNQLESAKSSLQASMGCYIDDIKVNTKDMSFELVCSDTPMPKMIEYHDLVEDLSSRTDYTKIVIGRNRTETISCDLKSTPHLLVAGETSSGKSSFIRQALTTLYRRNKTMQFSMIDLKAGLESNMFEGKKRIKIASDLKSAENHLKSIGEELEKRFKKLKSAGYTSINEIRSSSDLKMTRRVIVIDEITELFYGSRSKGSFGAREVINRIARQGRAAGLHLIIGTQRPDSRSLDTQIKANLSGKLCFKMADNTSSVIVLGSAKAKNLPAIAGRAIWQSGMKSLEVQTPFIDIHGAKAILDGKEVDHE